MRSLRNLALGAATVALLAGCATLRQRGAGDWPLLSPASLRQEASRPQRLSIARLAPAGDDHVLTLDAVVEVDASALRVAAFLLGQRVLLLAWDGRRLQEVREPVIPATLRGVAVLRDLQLVYWPESSLRERLPRGWRLEGDARHRRLFDGDRLVFESERNDDTALGSGSLVNHAAGYRLRIEAANEADR